jgi:hypothetical protein
MKVRLFTLAVSIVSLIFSRALGELQLIGQFCCERLVGLACGAIAGSSF